MILGLGALLMMVPTAVHASCLELNLATRPFRNNTLLWTGYALLAVAVVTFTAWNTVTFVDTRSTLDQLRNTVYAFPTFSADIKNLL